MRHESYWALLYLHRRALGEDARQSLLLRMLKTLQLLKPAPARHRKIAKVGGDFVGFAVVQLCCSMNGTGRHRAATTC